MVYDVKWLVGTLGAPMFLGAVVSWIVEYVFDGFHSLTPLGKKLVFIIGCLALPYVVACVGVWTGQLAATRELWVNTFLAGCVAFWTTQAAHIPHTGRR